MVAMQSVFVSEMERGTKGKLVAFFLRFFGEILRDLEYWVWGIFWEILRDLDYLD